MAIPNRLFSAILLTVIHKHANIYTRTVSL